MASQAQINANRSNAQRSTGPRTAAGKARAAMNSASHGLTAVKVVAGVEDAALFDALRDQLRREWRPGSILEVLLLDRMAELIWQLRRVAGVEVQVIERMPRLRPPGLPPEVYPMADAMARDFAKPNPTLLRVQMYQSRLERALHRALRELRALQIERQVQDEQDSADEDEAWSATVPGEQSSERMAGREVAPMTSATSAVVEVVEVVEVVASAAGDVPECVGTGEQFDARSPHLTSPRGRGTEGPLEIGNDKTNPILSGSKGLEEGCVSGFA